MVRKDDDPKKPKEIAAPNRSAASASAGPVITCADYELTIIETRNFDLQVTGTDSNTYSLKVKFPLEPKTIELVQRFFLRNSEQWPDCQFEFRADKLDRITEIL